MQVKEDFMLTKKLQFQALIDRLAGLQTPYSAQDFEGSLQRCWLALDSAPSGQAMHCVYRVSIAGQELPPMIG
jgi:hypothetical protein